MPGKSAPRAPGRKTETPPPIQPIPPSALDSVPVPLVAEKREVTRDENGEPKVHLIHFCEDGMTALGTLWYRGQELEIVEGSQEWEATLDREGHSWLEDLDDRIQYKRYGKIMFRAGEWPGEDWDDEVKAIEKARRRSAPTQVPMPVNP